MRRDTILRLLVRLQVDELWTFVQKKQARLGYEERFALHLGDQLERHIGVGSRTLIPWCDATWNPIRGCSRVSAGCEHCYAEKMAGRFGIPRRPDAYAKRLPYQGLVRSTVNGPRWTGDVSVVEEALDLPLRWKRPRRIFVNSMSDLFHEKVPDEWIDRIFAVMALAPQHTFQVLTKRPERMRAYLSKATVRHHVCAGDGCPYCSDTGRTAWAVTPYPNVWLGVSVEDQPTADARIPLLLQTPAAVRFVSYEPALGPVAFGTINGRTSRVHDSGRMDVLRGLAVYPTTHPEYPEQGYPIQPLDWLIIGGESGPHARPCDLAWIRSAVAQCRAAGVPVFVKQDSGPRAGQQGRIPDDLWIKECPP